MSVKICVYWVIRSCLSVTVSSNWASFSLILFTFLAKSSRWASSRSFMCRTSLSLRSVEQDLHQSVAISSSSARLQASQKWSFFSHNVCIIVLIGMSSVHFSGSPIDEGAGTNCLQSGHGKPTGFYDGRERPPVYTNVLYVTCTSFY